MRLSLFLFKYESLSNIRVGSNSRYRFTINKIVNEVCDMDGQEKKKNYENEEER